ncbi:hypothetical protein CsatA_019962 [Cannabis sativa]
MGLKDIAKKGMGDAAEPSGSKKRFFQLRLNLVRQREPNLRDLSRMFSPILTSRMKFLIWK